MANGIPPARNPSSQNMDFYVDLSSTLVLMLTLILVPYLSLMGSAISYLVLCMVIFCVVGIVSYQSILFKLDLKTVRIVLRFFLLGGCAGLGVACLFSSQPVGAGLDFGSFFIRTIS